MSEIAKHEIGEGLADGTSIEARDETARANAFEESAFESATGTSHRFENYERDFLLSLLEKMIQIREFEEGVKFLFLEGTMPGTIHQCQGQEATAVGVCAALRDDDWITSTFRGHGHALAKGLTPLEMLIELFGGKDGCCAGKGGSMHMGNMEKGMLPGIAIVGGGIPLAAGMALSFKMRKTEQVAACFFGDGAVAEGAFHEGVNMAAIWDVPAIFVCENNFYGASTHVSKVMKSKTIAERAGSYGIRGETVNGNDVLAVLEATQRAARECREGNGPVLLELLTYRRTGHSRRDPCHYQPQDERASWFERDPIDVFARELMQNNPVGRSRTGSDARASTRGVPRRGRSCAQRAAADFGRFNDRRFCVKMEKWHCEPEASARQF